MMSFIYIMPAFVHDFQYMISLLIVMLLFNHNDCSNMSCYQLKIYECIFPYLRYAPNL